MTSRTAEDFELELRCLPGVANVALSYVDNGDVAGVSLLVYGRERGDTENVAREVVTLYYPDVTVAVVDVGSWLRDASAVVESRVVLVRAEFSELDGACDIEVGRGGSIGRGRTGNGPLIGGAQATLAALRDLGYDIAFSLTSVTNVSLMQSWPVVVTLRSLSDGAERFGIALSQNDVRSAAAATLDALNRYLLEVPLVS